MSSEALLQQIFQLYTEFMQHSVYNTPQVSITYYDKLNTLHDALNNFLRSAFATPSISAALHSLRAKIPYPITQDALPQHFVLPPSITLPHHITYVDDPCIDICTIKPGSLVRHLNFAFIITQINFNSPLNVQDIEFYLKKQSSTLMRYFNFKNTNLTTAEISQLKPVTFDSKPNYGETLILSSTLQQQVIHNSSEIALKSPYQKNQAKLMMGITFTVQKVEFIQKHAQKRDIYYSPFFSGIEFSDAKIVNFSQIQPLIDPFEDLIVPQITSLCAFFDKQTLQFKPGKVIKQPNRVNRFHFQIQEIEINYEKLASKSINKSVCSVLNECFSIKNETIITVYSKFVTNLVCQISGDEILQFLAEDGREGIMKMWLGV
ncbi:hypothetical protein SS50377_26779 [Spironucleus salmonicida]|uniref:Uncharacterized protein n=1 Tax=Spironucleus salmonicida TaxID=348837 RepID=V6LYD4_9EUKA|nr:hypothetical protein SS50377_26779 [Spironucleus salmonicida]|eukprot:EST49248.1 Hypothetical protein SS50377_10468 [Spironucleus salmonicida]